MYSQGQNWNYNISHNFLYGNNSGLYLQIPQMTTSSSNKQVYVEGLLITQTAFLLLFYRGHHFVSTYSILFTRSKIAAIIYLRSYL